MEECCCLLCCCFLNLDSKSQDQCCECCCAILFCGCLCLSKASDGGGSGSKGGEDFLKFIAGLIFLLIGAIYIFAVYVAPPLFLLFVFFGREAVFVLIFVKTLFITRDCDEGDSPLVALMFFSFIGMLFYLINIFLASLVKCELFYENKWYPRIFGFSVVVLLTCWM